MNKIQDQFDIKIGAGTMYPILSSLKKHSLVNTVMYKKRKLYFLTNKGKINLGKIIKEYMIIQNGIISFFKKR